jgi:hypothetical protein
LGFLYGTIPEPEAVVSGFQDVAVVSEAIQESGRHLGVTEDGGPSRLVVMTMLVRS